MAPVGQGRWAAVAGGGFVLLAAWLTRLKSSLSYDEAFSVWVASHSIGGIAHQASLDGFTPPLFYVGVHVLQSLGLAAEDLRALPILFAVLGVTAALSFRPPGAVGRWPSFPAVAVFLPSALVLGFAHELRPYSVLLAALWLMLSELSHPGPRSDLRAGLIALVATAFSYLGAFLVALWLIECARRVAWSRLVIGVSLALALCLPALAKAARILTRISGGASIQGDASPLAPASLLFGLAPLENPRGLSALLWVLVIGALVFGWRSQDPVVRLGVRAAVLNLGLLFLLHWALGVGFAPRYGALAGGSLLFLLARLLEGRGRAGVLAAWGVGAVNVAATASYLFATPGPREDWRSAYQRIEERVGHEGTLLAFPYHHAAVTASVYSPGLAVGGGYTSRRGPTYWYEPPRLFRGYDFADLAPTPDLDRSLAGAVVRGKTCLITDEPDPTKTNRVFEAFGRVAKTAPLDTGDPRLRAVCTVL